MATKRRNVTELSTATLTIHGRFSTLDAAHEEALRWRENGWEAQALAVIPPPSSDIDYYTVVVGGLRKER